jgi:hypothetical protein
MRKPIRFVLAVTLLGALVASTASGQTTTFRTFPAAFCTPNAPGDAANISVGNYGVQNNSTSVAAGVQCPAATVFGNQLSYADIIVYDRNPSTNICCTIMSLSSEGVILASSTPCSSGSGSPSQQIFWSPPGGTGGNVQISCSIPPVSGGNISHVAHYRVETF